MATPATAPVQEAVDSGALLMDVLTCLDCVGLTQGGSYDLETWSSISGNFDRFCVPGICGHNRIRRRGEWRLRCRNLLTNTDGLWRIAERFL